MFGRRTRRSAPLGAPAPAPAPSPPALSADEAGVETAWRIHDKIAGATAAVDSKAAFLFTVQSAALVVIVTLGDQNRVLSRASSSSEVRLLVAGVLLLLAGAVLSATIVVPRLRLWSVRRRAEEWNSHFVYFGHLRHWNPRELEESLRNKPVLAVLSDQLIHMSRIAWRKHIAAIISLWVTLSGLASISGSIALVLHRG